MMSEARFEAQVDEWMSSYRALGLTEQLDSSSPIALELKENGLPWMVFIGGLNQRVGMPVHEFVGISSELRCNRVFVRDAHRLWYQRGLPGLTDTFTDTASFLRELLLAINPAPLGLVGSSAGGYAALGWAPAMEAQRVVAFSPQTTIAPLVKLRHDRRWLKFIWRAYLSAQSSVLDVAHVPSTVRDLEAHVIYPQLQPQDRFQAERLMSWPGLTLDGRESVEHSFIRVMRDSGELNDLLDSECLALRPTDI